MSLTTTRTTLANRALAHLGIGQQVTDYDERSRNAEAVRLQWDGVRDELLRMKEWRFAIKRVALTLLADPPAFGWQYAWQLPSDYIRELEFNCVPGGTGWTDHEIEGATLLSCTSAALNLTAPTDLPCANLRYIWRNETVSLWDANFCSAFTYLLAAACAAGLSAAPALGLQLRQMGEQQAALAFGPNGNEGRPRVISAVAHSSWFASRLVGSGGPGYLYTVPAWMRADNHGVWQNPDCGC